MDYRNAQRLMHIQSHCRDILYYVLLCEGSFSRFAESGFSESIRASLYHIGELAESVSGIEAPAYWDEVCAWAPLRLLTEADLDKQMLWNTAEKTVPELLSFCAQLCET